MLAVATFGVMVGATAGWVLDTRYTRDMVVYSQGYADGLNSCERRKTGFILPNGVTKGESLEALMDPRYSGT